MSRDDWVAIVKKRGIYRGYVLSGSCEYPTIKSMTEGAEVFKAKNIIEAILKAQEYNAEYGYKFVNLKLEEIDENKKE